MISEELPLVTDHCSPENRTKFSKLKNHGSQVMEPRFSGYRTMFLKLQKKISPSYRTIVLQINESCMGVCVFERVRVSVCLSERESQ